MAIPDTEIEVWRKKTLTSDHYGLSTTPHQKPHATNYIMNLALIDPFQLAQDSPDALTNDLSTYAKKKACLALVGAVHPL